MMSTSLYEVCHNNDARQPKIIKPPSGIRVTNQDQ